jgi:serine/threonine-protein kinase
VSLPSTRPASSPPPVPAYRDAAIKALSERIEHARARRATLFEAGLSIEDLDREILELRRQLRDGGQLLAGDALGDGRYLLVRPAGRGGFAVVWEAYDRSSKRPVAIKVLHAHLAGDPLRRARFFRGARIMVQLAGPGVVRVFEPEAEESGYHYFVMEFVHGGNLSEAVLNRQLDKARIFPLLLRVCETLAKAHEIGIVHRDIKPSNILLDAEGNPKLADFDLVGALDTTGGTRTGALGTLLYAAPECLDKPQDATASADVYGLGMTAIFCLSGQELTRSMFRHPERAVTRLDCSHRVKAVLQLAVAWEPSERFADAAAMQSALQLALEASTATSRTPGSVVLHIPTTRLGERHVRPPAASAELAMSRSSTRAAVGCIPPRAAGRRRGAACAIGANELSSVLRRLPGASMTLAA